MKGSARLLNAGGRKRLNRFRHLPRKPVIGFDDSQMTTSAASEPQHRHRLIRRKLCSSASRVSALSYRARLAALHPSTKSPTPRQRVSSSRNRPAPSGYSPGVRRSLQQEVAVPRQSSLTAKSGRPDSRGQGRGAPGSRAVLPASGHQHTPQSLSAPRPAIAGNRKSAIPSYLMLPLSSKIAIRRKPQGHFALGFGT